MTQRFRICDYGNCSLNVNERVHKTTVSRLGGEERKAFCCEQHAMLWLFDMIRKRTWMVYTPGMSEFNQVMEEFGKESAP
jgi:hypothetical protein